MIKLIKVSEFFLVNSSFIGNILEVDSHILLITFFNFSMITIENSKFISNVVQHGGILSLENYIMTDSPRILLILRENFYAKNNIKCKGGIMYINTSYKSFKEIENLAESLSGSIDLKNNSIWLSWLKWKIDCNFCISNPLIVDIIN